MLSLNEVDRVVDKAAAAAFKRRRLSRVYSEPTVDSVGADALRVMIVFRDDTYPEIKGEDAAKAVARIFEDLSKLGDDRIPIIEFATEEDLRSDGDPEF
jgi:hypothetical protein